MFEYNILEMSFNQKESDKTFSMKTIINKRSGFQELSVRNGNNKLCARWAVHDVEPS